MTYRSKSILFWILSFFLMASLALYQRATGPTYPKKGEIKIGEQVIDFKLLTSSNTGAPALNYFHIEDADISGSYEYKKLNSEEGWVKKTMQKSGDSLMMSIPSQPAAGKVQYKAVLSYQGQNYELTPQTVVIRFKGAVPGIVLIPHIFFMFFAMMFSLRTGIEVLINGKNTKAYTGITFILLLLGGMILGPIVQKYAFGEFWAGWPFGHDLTDNKTLVAFAFWVAAFMKTRKDKNHKTWVIIATIALLIVYLVPHSMFGSELDYSSGEIGTGNQ